MAKLFSTKIWDHARNPRNRGVLKDANVLVQAGDPDKGDALLYLLKIEAEMVLDAKFLARGSATAVAASSAATELAIGKSLDEVLALHHGTIAAALGGLPEEKMHCCQMAASALHAAVLQYRGTEEEVDTRLATVV